MIVQQIENLITPIVNNENISIVDIEFVKEGPSYVLRIFIDKIGGVTVDDCQKISGQVAHILEVYDVIADSYSLEISSPGVERRLKKISDFQKYSGRKVKIKLFKPVAGSKKILGTINKIKGQSIELRNCEQNKKLMNIDIKNISKANLVFEFGIK